MAVGFTLCRSVTGYSSIAALCRGQVKAHYQLQRCWSSMPTLRTRQQTSAYQTSASAPPRRIPSAAWSIDQDTVRADSGSCLEVHEQLGGVAMSEQ